MGETSTGNAEMNTKERSIKWQKLKGTYLRNQVIVNLCDLHTEKPAQIARRFGVSRQRIYQITHRVIEEKKLNWFRRLIDRWFPKS